MKIVPSFIGVGGLEYIDGCALPIAPFSLHPSRQSVYIYIQRDEYIFFFYREGGGECAADEFLSTAALRSPSALVDTTIIHCCALHFGHPRAAYGSTHPVHYKTDMAQRKARQQKRVQLFHRSSSSELLFLASSARSAVRRRRERVQHSPNPSPEKKKIPPDEEDQNRQGVSTRVGRKL